MYVTYAAIWEMKDVLPIKCDNVLIRLKESTAKLEEKFANFCNDLFINTTVKLTYSTLAFQVYISTLFISFNLINRITVFINSMPLKSNNDKNNKKTHGNSEFNHILHLLIRVCIMFVNFSLIFSFLKEIMMLPISCS